MAAIMEVIGLPPRSLIAKATRRKVFFDDDYNPIIKQNSRGKMRKPSSKPIESIIKVNDPDLIEFLKVNIFVLALGVLRMEAWEKDETRWRA